MTAPPPGPGAEGGRARPLEGKRIVVTRPRPQIPELARPLADRGAVIIESPAISIRPPDDPRPLEDALAGLDGFDWVVFTSANGVEEVIRRLGSHEGGAEALSGRRIAAVGPGTRAALEGRGVSVDLVPEAYRVESLAETLAAQGDLKGKRFLLPRAEQASPTLPEVLTREGAVVVQVAAYRTVPEMGGEEEVRGALEKGKVDYITFTSASTVHGFVGRLGLDAIRRGVPPARVAAIGPETSQAARSEGLEVDLEADPHSIPGLVDALVRDASS